MEKWPNLHVLLEIRCVRDNRPRERSKLNRDIRIRTAGPGDYASLNSLYPDSVSAGTLQNCIRDGTVILAEYGRLLLSTVAVDLEKKQIAGLYVDRTHAPVDLGPRMIASAERLAVQFGFLDLRTIPPQKQLNLFHSCGYRLDISSGKADQGKNYPVLYRSFPRRQTRYSRQISELLADLGIEPAYSRMHRIPLQQEATVLRSIGPDIYDRDQRMTPAAAAAWRRMKKQARSDSVDLQAVSAFRSVSYQEGIVRRKLDKGLSMKEILDVSAAPGFSEHHTGRAIDITTPGYPVLEEPFENSPAFHWLQARAEEFRFHLSFPRGTRHGVAYEPWHWAWKF